MTIINLEEATKKKVLLAGVVAGTSAQTSTYIDLQNCESVMLMVSFGAITSGAVTSIKAQQCDTSGGTYADLEGTSQTVADTDDDGVFFIDLIKPTERYIKVVISRATQNAVINGVWGIGYGCKKIPATDDATVAGAETHVTPDEGTA